VKLAFGIRRGFSVELWMLLLRLFDKGLNAPKIDLCLPPASARVGRFCGST
jgi:hypothetical protein